MTLQKNGYFFLLLALCSLLLAGCNNAAFSSNTGKAPEARQRILLDQDWRFFKYASVDQADALVYDVRPSADDAQDDRPADAMPTEAVTLARAQDILKPWILPTANPFIRDPAKHFQRPAGSPGHDFPFVQADFEDSAWESVSIPHDWAIAGPFFEGDNAEVGGGMARLPSPGVAWYRKKLPIAASDAGQTFYLDVEGAMSYAMVWLNGHLVGGWPYGYNSWRLDLTPYIQPGQDNQLAIRLDNPAHSARWYPGGGLYRNVWLTKTGPIHVAHWGTHITTPYIAPEAAEIHIKTDVINTQSKHAEIELLTEIYALNAQGKRKGSRVAVAQTKTSLKAQQTQRVQQTVSVANPQLWGPPPTQTPHLYQAQITLQQNGQILDTYTTEFGIRELVFDGKKGVIVNGEPIHLKGVNQHHDLGALGAAFNVRAAERQLEILREMGVNAIRMAHNPPATELLQLTDRMGFLVVNEIFDSWERKKTPLDFHLIFPEWHEPDLRALIRRDRNHASVIMWSIGNEVGEQYTAEAGAAVAQRLHDIAKEEDPHRPTTLSMNYAKPHMPIARVADVINLNYQGEGIRDAPAYAHLQGIRTTPLYPAFHEAFPNKVIISSENAAAVSSRGEYLFPVTEGISAPVADGSGGDPETLQVSAYELYTAPFGSSADKVLGSLEKHPYVAGGFIWSGWDYLGEPTPYYLARSSYFGVIDLAGFKKDRFYLYQSHWKPELPVAHILPHWNWPDRIGKITPVHVFTSGDEAELFLNGKSLGRQKKAQYQYRLRWDNVQYAPGELKVVTYKNGREWATHTVETTGAETGIALSADRNTISADGKDLSFITVKVVDDRGRVVPNAKNLLSFSLEGPGEIVATDNGDPADLTPFISKERKAFNGLALVIVKAERNQKGTLKLHVAGEGLQPATVNVRTQ